VVAGGVGAYTVLESASLQGLVAGLDAASLLVLVAGLVRRETVPVGACLAGLGAAWSVSAWTRGFDPPAATSLVAAALVVAAELAFAALEQTPVADEGELVARRAAGIFGRAVGALALTAVLLTALALPARGGLALEAVGVAAAVGTLALLVALARDSGTGER
jgi:hypothetical protein